MMKELDRMDCLIRGFWLGVPVFPLSIWVNKAIQSFDINAQPSYLSLLGPIFLLILWFFWLLRWISTAINNDLKELNKQEKRSR